MSTNTPIRYSSTFKHTDLQEIKLSQIFDDDTTLKYTAHKYTGSEGIEAIIHCNTRFQRAATKLRWNGPEKFEHYDEIIEDDALDYWDNQILPDYPNVIDQTLANFETALAAMVSNFCGGSKTRDHIIAYLESPECRKPKKTVVNQHIMRLQKIISVANSVEGTEDEIDDRKTRKIIFKSMPLVWQRNWSNAGKEIATCTIDEMKDYFNQQKIIMDSEVYQNNRQNNNQRGGRGRGRDNRNINRWNNPNNNKRDQASLSNNEQLCRHAAHKHLPENKQHKWKDCCYNPNSSKYIGRKGPGRGQGNDTGRGRGRGNSGRYIYNNQRSTQPQQEQHYQENSTVSNANNSANTATEEHHAFDMVGDTGASRAHAANTNTSNKVSWNLRTYESQHGA